MSFLVLNISDSRDISLSYIMLSVTYPLCEAVWIASFAMGKKSIPPPFYVTSLHTSLVTDPIAFIVL